MENEVRLIDANALVRFIDPGHLRNQFELCFSEDDVVSMIRNAPTIDPESLRPTARWAPVSKREDGAVEYECTNCGQKAWEKPIEGRKMGIDYGKYCIECGAKMEGEYEPKTRT